MDETDGVVSMIVAAHPLLAADTLIVGDDGFPDPVLVHLGTLHDLVREVLSARSALTEA